MIDKRLTSLLPALAMLATMGTAQMMYWQPHSKTGFGSLQDGILVEDPGRSMLLAFGGPQWLGLHEYDGKLWKRKSLTVEPSPRLKCGGVYDSARGRFVIFGGKDKLGKLHADTWEYDGKSWAPRIFLPKSPPASQGQMVYDVNRKVCVYVTASSSSSYATEVWEYDGKTWVLKKTKTDPGITQHFALAYDPVRKLTFLFGGNGPKISWASSATWSYDGTDWKQISTKHSPGRRIYMKMAFDLQRKVIVLHGGEVFNGGYTPDYHTFEFDGTDWRRADVQSLLNQGRYGAPLCYDSRRKSIVIGTSNYIYEYKLFPGSWTAFGKGCGSPAPVLAPKAGSYPKIGTSYPLSLSSLPKTAKGAILCLGASRTKWLTLNLPLDLKIFNMPGCNLLQSLDLLWMMTPSGGTYASTIALPNTPALAGQKLNAQSLVIVPNANPTWLVVSSAGEICIGN